MSGIRKKFSFQLLYALSQVLFPLITYPYITRVIGPQGLGLVGYVEYVSSFIITICAFGIPFYGVRETARLQHNPVKQKKILRQLLTLHCLLSIAGAAVFGALMLVQSSQALPPLLLFLGCITILLPPFMAEWYMQGTESFQFTTIRSIILRLIGLLSMLLFVRTSQDFTIYFLIIVMVQGAVAITNQIKIGFARPVFRLRRVKVHIRPLWHFFLTASLISVYVFFDVMILGLFGNETSVGYYAVAVRLVKLSLLLVLSLNVILFPRISSLLAAGEEQKVQLLLQTALQFIVLLTLPIAFAFYFLAPEIMLLLAGESFRPAILLLQILSPLPLVIGLSNFFVYQVLVPFGKERLLLRAVLITCVCSLLLHLSLVANFTERGTAVATLATESCMMLLTAFFAFRTYRFTFPLKTGWQSLVAIAPLLLLILFCRRQLESPVLILLCSLLPGLLMYGFLHLFLFKNGLAKDVFSLLLPGKKWVVTNG